MSPRHGRRVEGLRVFQTIARVSLAAQSGRSARRVCREEKALFRRADHRCLAAGRGRVPVAGTSAARSACPSRRSTAGRRHTAACCPVRPAELKQLRDENTKLKRLVADLPLDKVMLKDVVEKVLKPRSLVVRPGRCPASRCACRTHFRSVSALQPSFGATDCSTAHSEAWASRCFSTIRTARSRTSGENRLRRPIDPILPMRSRETRYDSA